MATFGQIKADVATNVIDLPPTVTAKIPDLVNGALQSMQSVYNYRAMEGYVPYTTTVGSRTLGTISGFKEYRDDPYLLRQNSRAKKILTALDTNVDQAVLANADFPGEPEFIMNTVDAFVNTWTITISPYPDDLSDWDDGNYRIIVPVYVYSATMVSDSETNWFTNRAADYLTYKATAEAFARDWDYDSMALWLQRANEKLKEVRKADMMNRISTVDTLVPLWRGANQPQVRN